MSSIWKTLTIQSSLALSLTYRRLLASEPDVIWQTIQSSLSLTSRRLKISKWDRCHSCLHFNLFHLIWICSTNWSQCMWGCKDQGGQKNRYHYTTRVYTNFAVSKSLWCPENFVCVEQDCTICRTTQKSQILSNLSSAWLLTSEFQFASQDSCEKISGSFGKFTDTGKNLRGWGGSLWMATLQLMEAVSSLGEDWPPQCVLSLLSMPQLLSIVTK